jgi:leader peptidase (prepilin peptidase)/N-methyltransferase
MIFIEMILMAILGFFLGRYITSLTPEIELNTAEGAVINHSVSQITRPSFVVESILAIAFAVITWKLGLGLSLFFALSVTFLSIFCFYSDFQKGVLLDVCTLGLVWIGLIASLFSWIVSSQEAILGAALGYSFFWAFNALYRAVRGKEGMYPGDFKLNAGIGACVGVKWMLPTLFLALLLLLAFSFGKFILLKRDERKRFLSQEMPYGCFAAVAFLFAITVILIR